jgi:hypothetical protein
MSVTIVDEKLSAELAQANGPVQVRSRDGRILGLFTPQPFPEPNISEEELLRRENDTTGKNYTAAEVEAKLRELRCSQ